MQTAAAALLFLAGGTGPAPADSLSHDRPIVHAVRLSSPLSIDGVLDEAVWKECPVSSEFRQRDPIEGGTPSQRTEVRVAYDDDALYIGARMWDSAPDSILARLTRRDVSISADRFCVYMDPYHDRRSGYYFMVNAAGTKYDGTMANDGFEDDSWDGVWSGQARRDDQGWTLEMRIPYSQLRFQKGEQQVWGIDFRRVIARHNEEDFLVYPPKKESGFVSRFPDLVGIQSIHPPRSIELMPYVTTRAEYLRHAPLDPFNDGSDYVPDIGGDLRTGLGSRFTLNATVNPDFGQVEVDPAVVNLSDVETFYPEKRPFFVEGSQNFNFGQEGASDYWGFNWPQPTFFYSRRIGRAPQGSFAETDSTYSDVPLGSRILGAAKITGKIGSTFNLGMLHSVTARERADLETAGIRSRADVEPLTYYGVARGQKEFAGRRYGLGGMATLAERRFDEAALRNQLNRQSVFSGLDGWVFLDKGRNWVISGWSGVSQVAGSAARITAVQTDQRHYFQRPDADHVEVDRSATQLTGFGSRYWLNKQNGSVLCNAALGFMSPKFDVNDLGFISRADLINGHLGTGYRWTETTKWRKYVDWIGATWESYDFQGNPISGGLYAGNTIEFINNYSWSGSVLYSWPNVNNRRTRGGPLTLNKQSATVNTYIDTDGKAKLFYFLTTNGSRSESGTWTLSLNPGVEWKPVSSLTMRLGPRLDLVREDAQYVTAFGDSAALLTFGRRYVFAKLHQNTASAELRVNWAFTPALSFQGYLQPLISAADYHDFKSLARARSYDFTPYPYGGNPDFNERSLRGSAVLRWEYLPGSTLFLVWTQQRDETLPTGEFDFGPSLSDLVRDSADNIFLAKLTYYFSL